MGKDTWFFISDLHLSEATPKTLDAFERWMVSTASPGIRIAVLGDLFETWIGDDARSDCSDRVARAFESAYECGARCHFLHGNRDFLLGEGFAEMCHLELESDPWLEEVGGVMTLITHADALCLDDAPYQKFRAMTRDASWKADFLSKPLEVRQSIARSVRTESEQSKQGKSMEIMDVSPAAVEHAFKGHWVDRVYIGPVTRMIHGHTHRPGVHAYTVPIKGIPTECTRWVLPDWRFDEGGKAGCLRVTPDGIATPIVF